MRPVFQFFETKLDYTGKSIEDIKKSVNMSAFTGNKDDMTFLQ